MRLFAFFVFFLLTDVPLELGDALAPIMPEAPEALSELEPVKSTALEVPIPDGAVYKSGNARTNIKNITCINYYSGQTFPMDNIAYRVT